MAASQPRRCGGNITKLCQSQIALPLTLASTKRQVSDHERALARHRVASAKWILAGSVFGLRLRCSWLDNVTRCAISQRTSQGVSSRRNIGAVRRQASKRRRIQVAVGGVSGVAAVVIIVGTAIARLTTTSDYSAEVIVTGLTIAGSFIGGFFVVPYLNGITLGADARPHDKDLS